LALREFGRIERTLFTLDWLLDKDLRQRVTTEFEQVVHRIGRLSAEARSGAMRPLEAGTPFLLFTFHPGCYSSPHEDLGRDR
jgi:hypothetical protein